MSNALNRALASTLLVAAAAFGGAAQAGPRGEDPAVARQRIADCYKVGQEKGVERLPLTNKAMQQDRSEKLLGCVYNAAAGEELIVAEAYDLADPKQAADYGKDVKKLKADETKAAQKLAKEGGKVDENGNVVRDTAKETADTVKDVNKTVREGTRAVREVDKLRKGLEGFGLKF